jgi:hypothetical protein
MASSESSSGNATRHEADSDYAAPAKTAAATEQHGHRPAPAERKRRRRDSRGAPGAKRKKKSPARKKNTAGRGNAASRARGNSQRGHAVTAAAAVSVPEPPATAQGIVDAMVCAGNLGQDVICRAIGAACGGLLHPRCPSSQVAGVATQLLEGPPGCGKTTGIEAALGVLLADARTDIIWTQGAALTSAESATALLRGATPGMEMCADKTSMGHRARALIARDPAIVVLAFDEINLVDASAIQSLSDVFYAGKVALNDGGDVVLPAGKTFVPLTSNFIPLDIVWAYVQHWHNAPDPLHPGDLPADSKKKLREQLDEALAARLPPQFARRIRRRVICPPITFATMLELVRRKVALFLEEDWTIERVSDDVELSIVATLSPMCGAELVLMLTVELLTQMAELAGPERQCPVLSTPRPHGLRVNVSRDWTTYSVTFPDGRGTAEVPRPDGMPAATFSREGRLVNLEVFRPPEDGSRRFGDPTAVEGVSYNLADTVPDNRAAEQVEAEIVRLRGEVARLHNTIDGLTDRHEDSGGGGSANAAPLSGAQCPDCGKIAKNTNALRTHKSRFHRD